jgi:hypothetical protein
MESDQSQTYTRQCVSCSAEFTLTSGEISWYVQKGYPLPKRCKPCRVEKRDSRQEWS